MALDLISPVNDVYRRDFDLADTSKLDPNEADSLKAGEWCTPTGTSAQMARVGATSVPDCYQMFSQKGDYAAQALGKASFLFLREYEAETDMFDPDTTFAVGMELTVHQITMTGDSHVSSILTEAAVDEYVHAICSMADGSTPSLKLRFRKISPYMKSA